MKFKIEEISTKTFHRRGPRMSTEMLELHKRIAALPRVNGAGDSVGIRLSSIPEENDVRNLLSALQQYYRKHRAEFGYHIRTNRHEEGDGWVIEIEKVWE